MKNLGHEMAVLDESVSSLTREKAALHEVHQQVLHDLQAHQDKLSMLQKAKSRLEQHVEDVRQLLPVCLYHTCLLSHLSAITPSAVTPVCYHTNLLSYLSVCYHTCLSAITPVCYHTCLLSHLSVIIPVCYHTCLLSHLSVCYCTCLSAITPVCYHTCLSAITPLCYHTCLSVIIPVCMLAYLSVCSSLVS